MKYRGQECNPRPFDDTTGTGTEWLTPDGFIAIREHATRILSEDEKASQEKSEQAAIAAKEASIKQQAVTALLTSGIEMSRGKELADKIAELKTGISVAVTPDQQLDTKYIVKPEP